MDPAGCVETYDDEFFLLSPEMFQQVECVSGWESECVSKESRKKSDFFGDPTTLALPPPQSTTKKKNFLRFP